jgi:hypothetical protein
VEVIILIHPGGGVQNAGGEEIVVGKIDTVSVGNRDVGDAISVNVWIEARVAVGVGKLDGNVEGI